MFSEILPNWLWTVVIFLVTLCVTYEYRRRRGLPPGPYGLPFIGYILSMDRKNFNRQVTDLCETYRTNILTIPNPGPPMIVLNDYDLIKECFQKRTDLADRIRVNFFNMFDPGRTGLVLVSGEQWRETRRFCVHALKDFGMGRTGAEERIQNESRILSDQIEQHRGQAFDPRDLINVAVSNIICGMVFGRRFDSDHHEFSEALKGIQNLFRHVNSMLFFFALKVKFIRRFIVYERYKLCCREYGKFSDFVMRRIAEHKESFNGEVNDLIDGFFKEIEEGSRPDIFNENGLRSVIVDLFVAGSETTATTLRWCILTMAAYPEIQRKIHEELDQVMCSKIASMGDRKMTPYTEAVLCEVQRKFSLLPFGLAHSNNHQDIYVDGYRIPKDSIVVANLNRVHNDPRFWKNPDLFDPGHFLENGKVDNLEKLVPFGLGRRSCAGESLARMELYIFFATLLKRYEILPETDDTISDMEGDLSTVYQPKPFNVRMKCR